MSFLNPSWDVLYFHSSFITVRSFLSLLFATAVLMAIVFHFSILEFVVMMVVRCLVMGNRAVI